MTIYAGVDVAKDSLALDFQGRTHALSNDARGHARLGRILRTAQNVHVVFEATGGYEQGAVRRRAPRGCVEAPGVASVTAATLLAEMPKLGTLSDEGRGRLGRPRMASSSLSDFPRH